MSARADRGLLEGQGGSVARTATQLRLEERGATALLQEVLQAPLLVRSVRMEQGMVANRGCEHNRLGVMTMRENYRRAVALSAKQMVSAKLMCPVREKSRLIGRSTGVRGGSYIGRTHG